MPARCELDTQGRILLPQFLREFAGLVKDVTVVGNNQTAEFWIKRHGRRLMRKEITLTYVEGMFKEARDLMEHIPVLLKECIEGLNIRADGIYVDGTLGRAGHAAEIANISKAGGSLALIRMKQLSVRRKRSSRHTRHGHPRPRQLSGYWRHP